MELDKVVEVVETGWEGANYYLGHGDRLLSVMGTSRVKQTGATQQFYILRRVTYVLGRPATAPKVPWPIFPRRDGAADATVAEGSVAG